MGARGPLKVPAHLQLVPPSQSGTASGRTETTAAEKVHLGAPVKPRGLPAAASKAWDEIVPVLDEAGMLSPADGLTLELALRHFVQARAASVQLLRAKSVTIHDYKNGRDAKHPASQIMRDHSAEFLKYAAQLGLSFAARARVTVAADAPSESGNPYA